MALVWQLHRSPTSLLIPGTTSAAHVDDNLAAAELAFDEEEMRTLTALSPEP